MKKILLTEAEKAKIILEREKLIIANFAKTFNKIKRIDESELDEDIQQGPVPKHGNSEITKVANQINDKFKSEGARTVLELNNEKINNDENPQVYVRALEDNLRVKFLNNGSPQALVDKYSDMITKAFPTLKLLRKHADEIEFGLNPEQFVKPNPEYNKQNNGVEEGLGKNLAAGALAAAGSLGGAHAQQAPQKITPGMQIQAPQTANAKADDGKTADPFNIKKRSDAEENNSEHHTKPIVDMARGQDGKTGQDAVFLYHVPKDQVRNSTIDQDRTMVFLKNFDKQVKGTPEWHDYVARCKALGVQIGAPAPINTDYEGRDQSKAITKL